MVAPGIHETSLAQIAATIGGALAGDWFEHWIGSVSMALATGVVAVQDTVAPESAGLTAQERVKILQEVCADLFRSPSVLAQSVRLNYVSKWTN